MMLFSRVFPLNAAHNIFVLLYVRALCIYMNIVSLCKPVGHTNQMVLLEGETVNWASESLKAKSNLLSSCRTFFFQTYRLLYFYCTSLC